MDSQLNRSRHGEEPNPLPLQVLDNHLKEEEEEETIILWKKGDSAENQYSATESEGTFFPCESRSRPTYRQPCHDFNNNFDDVTSSKAFSEFFLEEDEVYSTKNISRLDRYEGRTIQSPKQEYSHKAPRNSLQSLSHFFTENEIKMMPSPDAVLSIGDKYFVVLPNSGTTGQTLFHCLAQAITGKEQDYSKLRESVIDYICSQSGWDLLGHLVVSFYEPLIDEFQSSAGAKHFGEDDKIQRRIYRHYFMDGEIEGSFIELVAASVLYGFSFTCTFLQEQMSGRTHCRIFNSSDYEETIRTLESTAEQVTRKDINEMNHFLRVGETSDNWRWTLVVPYLRNYFDVNEDMSSWQCESIARGHYDVKLWNVYGLNWDRRTSLVRISPRSYFCWRTGISVISTSSGKLLGGYTTFGKDLFSNLCCLLPNCLHLDNHCLLNDVVSYCPSKLRLKFNDPVTLFGVITHNKDFLRRKRGRWKRKPQEDTVSVGTLKDLHKASKIFNFGYYVIGIDEYGVFRSLKRRESERIIYLIVRTNGDMITEWRALGDMRNFSEPTGSKDNVATGPQTSSLVSSTSANSESDSSPFLKQKHKDSWRRYMFSPFRLHIAKYFTRLRLFIGRIKDRNKVQQAKIFSLSDSIT